MYPALSPLSGNSIDGRSSWNPTAEAAKAAYGMARLRHGKRPKRSSPVVHGELDELHHADDADQHDSFASEVVGDRHEDAEHHQVADGSADQGTARPHPVEPPDDHGDGGRVRELRQQLAGVAEERRCGRHRGGDREGEDTTDAPADDAVDEHQPDAERRHFDELQAVVVEVPQVHERRQQQGQSPRIRVRAEGAGRVEDGETVVGDDLADVAVEQAARLTEVEGEVVTPGMTVAMQRDREHGGGRDHDPEGDRRG